MQKPTQVFQEKRPPWLLLLIIVLLGFALRLFRLGSKSLWLDEAHGLRVALKGQATLWAGQSELYHPPLFYWLLERWYQLGQGEFELRLLAVIASTACIIALFFLAKDWLGTQVAWSAAALLACSPLFIWYAQESRPYALLSLLGLLATLALYKLLHTPSFIWWLLFVTCMTMALYLHYGAILLIPLQIVLLIYFLATRQSTWKTAVYWSIGIGLALLAWWPWLSTPAAGKFLGFVFTDRNYLYEIIIEPLGIPPVYLLLSLSLVAIVSFVGLYGLRTRYAPLRRAFNAQMIRDLPTHNWAQIGAGIMFLLLLLLSVFPRGYTVKRQMILFLPYILLIFAWFWPWQRKFRNWLALILTLSLAAALVNIVAIPKPQWREANEIIVQGQQEGDLVLIEPRYMTIPFDYYNEGRSERQGAVFAVSPDKLLTLLDEHERLWLVIHQVDYDAQQRTATWLDEHALLLDTVDLHKLQVRLYESPPSSP